MKGDILVSGLYEHEYLPVIAALIACGAPAERVRSALPEQRGEARALARSAAAVVLGGGHDLDPAWYGEEPIEDPEIVVCSERDELDRELFAGAREARVPLYGVCRGMQVVNVLLGGSLWQDLPSQRPSEVPHQVRQPLDALAHRLEVSAPETRSGTILARQEARVNSRHHQAIRRLAGGLVPVASSPDGVIEAVELVGADWWLRGVQWHPEDLTGLPQQQALWGELLAAAGCTPAAGAA